MDDVTLTEQFVIVHNFSLILLLSLMELAIRITHGCHYHKLPQRALRYVRTTPSLLGPLILREKMHKKPFNMREKIAQSTENCHVQEVGFQ